MTPWQRRLLKSSLDLTPAQLKAIEELLARSEPVKTYPKKAI